MIQESRYLTDKSVYITIAGSALVIAYAVLLWVFAPDGFKPGFWAGLVFMLVGLAGVICNVMMCCWYPVVLDRHVILQHSLLSGRTRVIRYEDILYAKVADFRVRLWKHSPVMTIVTRDGKKRNYVLMTRLEQIGRLSREILDKGVPDACQIAVQPGGRKVYFSSGALIVICLLAAVLLSVLVLGMFNIHDARLILLFVLLVPTIVLLMLPLSYIVVDGRRVVVKHVVFKYRTLDIDLDDVMAMEIDSQGYLTTLLKSPDKNGKVRYTRMVGLIDIYMAQEINAWVKSQL